MTTLSHSTALPSLLLECASFVRRSRSIASMLPALVLSGLATLIVTGLLQESESARFLGAWMESWLIAWPITFPVVYVLGSALLKLAASLSAPSPVRHPGLGYSDVADASERVTAAHGFTVLRTLKVKDDFRA
jgi:hypothetical protein